MNAAPLSASEPIVFRPNSLKQEKFFSSSADIAIYGGAAGSGKTTALVVDPLRYVRVPGFSATIFRRTLPQVKAEGGLWPESFSYYPMMGGFPLQTRLEWRFPHPKTLIAPSVRFTAMQYEVDRFEWMGAQIPYIGFDQLEHFTERQFWYMLSRNRSMCGVDPCIRANCNPDPDSWIRTLLDWWIDNDTGLPIQERSGVLRWMVRVGNAIKWGDSKAELLREYGDIGITAEDPKSLTFIPATIYDNQTFIKKNPRYLGNLKLLPLAERQQLLDGNWNARAVAGTFFRREWFGLVDAADVPHDGMRYIRYWDRASTEVTEAVRARRDPDWTVGLLLGMTPDHTFYVLDVDRFRLGPHDVKTRIRKNGLAEEKRIGLEQDPAAAGVAEIDYLTRELAGLEYSVFPVSKAKAVRARPVSSAAKPPDGQVHGLIKVVRASWNKDFFTELENFADEKYMDPGTHDDQVDALSGAFNALALDKEDFDLTDAQPISMEKESIWPT